MAGAEPARQAPRGWRAGGLAALGLAAGLAAGRGTVAAEAADGMREAPLVVQSAEVSAGLALEGGRIVDRVGVGATDANPVIEAFVFQVASAPRSAPGVEAVLEVASSAGSPHRFTARLESVAPGDTLRIPARIVVTPEMEGPFTASLRVSATTGQTLYAGRYGFGYPRHHTTTDLERISCGAGIRDAFETPAIDPKLWRQWVSDPNGFTHEQSGGRYRMSVIGPAGYNGLVSLTDMGSRDVVAVCRTGIESPQGAQHSSLMHLCGSGPWSPDHWIEVQLRDADGKAARATSVVAVPPAQRQSYRGTYLLPHPARDGYLVKVECDGATNRCAGHVKVDEEWWQIGEAFEVAARRTRLELKTAGPEREGRRSVLWFDDCRVYPRPESHYVSVALLRADGRGPGARSREGGSQICFDAANRPIADCDLTVRLFAAGGNALVAETQTGTAFGYAMLALRAAPWDTYPVAAVIRVLANGQQVGPDHLIEMKDVEGLYPDDVYKLVLR